MAGRLKPIGVVCVLAGALALALASCGGDSPEATANAKTTAISSPSSGDAAAGDPGKPKPSPSSRCLTRLDPFLKAMDSLRRNLVAGLAYPQYVGEVKKIIAVYDEVPAGKLTLGCVQAVGTPAEQALNRYIAAGNTWTDCVEVPTCEAVSVEAPLQSQWSQASKYLSKAERGLSEPGAG